MVRVEIKWGKILWFYLNRKTKSFCNLRTAKGYIVNFMKAKSLRNHPVKVTISVKNKEDYSVSSRSVW